MSKDVIQLTVEDHTCCHILAGCRRDDQNVYTIVQRDNWKVKGKTVFVEKPMVTTPAVVVSTPHFNSVCFIV